MLKKINLKNSPSSLDKSSSELLRFGLERARAFYLFTTTLKLGSSLEPEPRLGPTSNSDISGGLEVTSTRRSVVFNFTEFVDLR
jgi:hypothetical protein